MQSVELDDSSYTSSNTQPLSSKNNILLNTSLNQNFMSKKQEFYEKSKIINGIEYGNWNE